MSPSTSSRPLTRSQTSPSVLGKRTTRALTRSSSLGSNSSSTPLPTPESTPKAKRARTSIEEEDGRANKENVPPLRDLILESPSASRLRRRDSISSDVSQPSVSQPSTSARPATTPRRHESRSTIPQTPASAMASLSLVTPPPTPPSSVPLSLRLRSLLRATYNTSNGMSMAGREKEQTIIESFLHGFDEDVDVPERVLYVSGSPGTGKTALVNSILSNKSLDDDVKVIFLNCMAIPNMDVLWQRLEEELSDVGSRTRSNRRTATKSKLHGRDLIALIFEKRRDMKCVLVLDELDSLSKTSSATLQPLFRLPAVFSSFRIIGIANTHTLTASSSTLPSFLHFDEKSSTSPTSQKLSVPIKTIHFAPYTSDELLSILKTRFDGLPQDEVQKFLPTPTLLLLTKKVSSLTGDVRILFEVLRGAIDLCVPGTSDSTCFSQGSASALAPKGNVTPSNILTALKAHAPSASPKTKGSLPIGVGATSNSEIVTKVRNLNLQARLVLLALVLASKRISSGLHLSSSSSSSPSKGAVSPTKRSPMKRSNSSANNSCNALDTTSGIDTTQLHAYYSSLLTTTDAFSPVSRSDFTDILGVLETTGLLSLSSPSTRAFKRTTSFTSIVGKSKSASSKGGAQLVALQSDVREAEVSRGLGIESGANSEADVLEDDVRNIWTKEVQKIKREAKTKEALLGLEEIVGFEGALES